MRQKKIQAFNFFIGIIFSLSCLYAIAEESQSQIITPEKKKLVYLVSDHSIPFWEIMGRGIKTKAHSLGYEVDIYSANNNAKRELELTLKAIRERVAGIIISPTNSSACVTVLKLAKDAGIPVVISDIGADQGDYISFISSDNYEGAYQIGKVLAKELSKLGWQNGRVGIISIPQKRKNGKLRTAGFMLAMNEAGIKSADLRQQVNFSYQETYDFSSEMINKYPNLRALWLQGSNQYQAALDAIADAGKKDEILLICFDSEPEFLEMIPEAILVGAAMQQPFLMGEIAIEAMDKHLRGQLVDKEYKLPVLAISRENIKQKLPIIKRNVLGLEVQ